MYIYTYIHTYIDIDVYTRIPEFPILFRRSPTRLQNSRWTTPPCPAPTRSTSPPRWPPPSARASESESGLSGGARARWLVPTRLGLWLLRSSRDRAARRSRVHIYL